MKRREFLKSAMTLGVLGSVARISPAFAGLETPVRSRTSGRAKSVIELWIWGGPSHLESFDPKPKASNDYNGGRGAIPTNVDGIFLSEYMPQMAKIADKYSIIRSMTHPFRGHETATYLMQTGRTLGGGITYPAIGAMLAMLNGGNVKHNLPAYVALTTAKGRFSPPRRICGTPDGLYVQGKDHQAAQENQTSPASAPESHRRPEYIRRPENGWKPDCRWLRTGNIYPPEIRIRKNVLWQ